MTACLAETCAHWTGDGCACRVFGIDPVDARTEVDGWAFADVQPASDPCDYCPHDNTEHAEDGCRECECAVPQ